MTGSLGEELFCLETLLLASMGSDRRSSLSADMRDLTFLSYLEALKARGKVDPSATSIPARATSSMLKKLGMSHGIDKGTLRDIMQIAGYAEEVDGNIDSARFALFAEDLKLAESVNSYIDTMPRAPRLPVRPRVDRGPLGRFFAFLVPGRTSGSFHVRNFRLAFSALGAFPPPDDCDSLARYSGLHAAVPVNFEQFLRILDKEHSERRQRTGLTCFASRTVAMDRNLQLHRLMLFASAYTRNMQLILSRSSIVRLRHDASSSEGDSLAAESSASG